MYLLPPPLKPGDTIGIAAPASSFDREAFAKGASQLSQMGFTLYVPEALFAGEGYFAGNDEHRAQLLMRLFLDETVKAVMCARGGFGSPRVLPLLDYEAIRKHPKVLIGFSDITALLCAITERCGWVTFHGPMVLTLPATDADSQRGLGAALRSEFPLIIAPRDGVSLRPGVASGPVIGGNLTTVCHLLGTPYEPVWKGRILFIEECGEALYRIDRMLTHLKLAGCLDLLAGIVLGAFEGIESVADVWRIVMSITRAATYPVAAGFPIGHGAQNMTIPMGMTAMLDAGEPALIFKAGCAS
ncbi:MAG: LD-carboxypeptidase [Desulfobacterales bacterium]|jgi:muramoyltetrapeptide carboxypeptidase|nr:LD-carboxypeptidase [Desulfobacterales bacterium]